MIMKNPLQLFYRSIGVWIYFILFTKLPISFTIFIFILLLLLFIIRKYEKYYRFLEKNNVKKEIEKINKLEIFKQYIFYIIIGLTIIGNILYMLKQKKRS